VLQPLCFFIRGENEGFAVLQQFLSVLIEKYAFLTENTPVQALRCAEGRVLPESKVFMWCAVDHFLGGNHCASLDLSG